jgi:hypothetical protein
VHRNLLIRSAWLVPLAVAAASLAACAGGGQVTVRPPHTPAATASASPVSVAPQVSLVLDEQSDNKTVQVHVGARVELLLHSSYWMIHGSSQPSVLQQDGPTTALPGRKCVPGGGCNPVMTLFTALRAGNAVVTASRTSCGEAEACSASQGTFAVTVTVAG